MARGLKDAFRGSIWKSLQKAFVTCCDAFGLYMQPLKVQYVILTASGCNGYSRTNSKYLRALFLLPSPQIWHFEGCQIEDTEQEQVQFTKGRQQALRSLHTESNISVNIFARKKNTTSRCVNHVSHCLRKCVVIKIHKEFRSGSIFCVFASVASILIEWQIRKQNAYKNFGGSVQGLLDLKLLSVFNTPSGRIDL